MSARAPTCWMPPPGSPMPSRARSKPWRITKSHWLTSPSPPEPSSATAASRWRRKPIRTDLLPWRGQCTGESDRRIAGASRAVDCATHIHVAVSPARRQQRAGGGAVGLSSQMQNPSAAGNSMMVIAPYWQIGTWVFDDSATGLVREPFVAGVPEMIDELEQLE